jgi:hypothetical protein
VRGVIQSLCHPERSPRSRRTPASGLVRTVSAIRAPSGALFSSRHQSTALGIWNSDPHPTHRRRCVGLSLSGRGNYALAREIPRCAQDDATIGRGGHTIRRMSSEGLSLCHPERSLRSRRTPASGLVRTVSSIRALSHALVFSCHPERSEESRVTACAHRSSTPSRSPHSRTRLGLSRWERRRGWTPGSFDSADSAQDDTKKTERGKDRLSMCLMRSSYSR